MLSAVELELVFLLMSWRGTCFAVEPQCACMCLLQQYGASSCVYLAIALVLSYIAVIEPSGLCYCSLGWVRGGLCFEAVAALRAG